MAHYPRCPLERWEPPSVRLARCPSSRAASQAATSSCHPRDAGSAASLAGRITALVRLLPRAGFCCLLVSIPPRRVLHNLITLLRSEAHACTSEPWAHVIHDRLLQDTPAIHQDQTLCWRRRPSNATRRSIGSNGSAASAPPGQQDASTHSAFLILA